jgi:hypothetical protein
MQPDSLRESGLRWLSHALGPLPRFGTLQANPLESLEPRLCVAYRAVDGKMAAGSARPRGGILLAP